jgi:aryl-alcohol dehydrogenase-like predicted oxidoreductase
MDALPTDTPRHIGDRVVGPIGLGCWRFTDPHVDRATSLVDTALDLGITLVDTADVYGLDWGGTGFGTCEEHLGAVLARRPDLRDRMVLATKGGIVPGVPYQSGRNQLERACEASLRRLGVDHVDLYQVHRPDLFTHPADTAAALGSLVARGLTAHVGVSNHSVAQTAALQAHLEVPLVSVQPEWSAVQLDPLRDGTLDHAMATGLAVLAWSPLAGGRLATGDGVRPELLAVLDELASREATTRTAVALAFVLAHPSAPVALVGTQRAERLADAVAALTVRLDRSDVYRIVEASDGVPLP